MVTAEELAAPGEIAACSDLAGPARAPHRARAAAPGRLSAVPESKALLSTDAACAPRTAGSGSTRGVLPRTVPRCGKTFSGERTTVTGTLPAFVARGARCAPGDAGALAAMTAAVRATEILRVYARSYCNIQPDNVLGPVGCSSRPTRIHLDRNYLAAAALLRASGRLRMPRGRVSRVATRRRT